MKDTYMPNRKRKPSNVVQDEGDWVVIRRRKVPASEPLILEAERVVPKPPAPSEPDTVVVAQDVEVSSDAPLAQDGSEVADADLQDVAEDDATALHETHAPDAHPVPEEPQDAVAEPMSDVDEPMFFVPIPDVSEAPNHPLMLANDGRQTSPQVLWDTLPEVDMGARSAAGSSAPTLLDFFRADPIAKGFDLLRTRMVRSLRDHGWKRVAIASPTRGCGTTFTAVNLALSLARVAGSRTLLMDLNQRNPGIAQALSLSEERNLQQFLNAEASLQSYFVRPMPTLAVGLADTQCDYASEILHDPLTEEILEDTIDLLRPDLVLYDLPPVLSHDDFAAFLPQVDAVLLVADGTKTLPDHITACERILENQTQLLGVVLNRGRTDSQGDIIG